MALGARSLHRSIWLSLLLAACTASGSDVEGVTFGSGYDPNPDDDDVETDTALPSVTAGDPSATDGGTTAADSGDSNPTDPTGDPSTSGTPGECTPGDTAPCYDGPANTENVGECQSGTQTCQGDGTWGTCQGSIVPGTEACNGLDDDCNAVVDDGNPGGGGPCTTTLLGPCSAGTLQCTPGGVTCEPNVPPAAQEICDDSIDNDCNGQVDDGCVTATPCDPMNPAISCGGGQHCTPSTTGQTTCSGPTGIGTQYSACLADADCAPGFVCVDTGFGIGSVYCMQWCTDTLQCPILTDLCQPITPPVYAGLVEHGVCYDGLP